MTDDELLARVMRRILQSDGYDAPCVILEDDDMLIDGWTDVTPDEHVVLSRVRAAR